MFWPIANITCCQKLFQVDAVHISYWKMPPQEMSAAPREENVSTNFQNSQFSTNVVETFDGYVIQNQTLGIRLEF